MKVATFHNTDPLLEVESDWYDKLRKCAFEADMKRARLCLHSGPGDRLHEMIVVFHRDTVIRPHRHSDKSESFHVIFGELDIILFDDDGRPTRVIKMGDLASGRTLMQRMSKPIWHSVVVRSEYAGIHEVTNGPFRIEENEFAPWAPEEPAALRAFLEESIAAVEAR